MYPDLIGAGPIVFTKNTEEAIASASHLKRPLFVHLKISPAPESKLEFFVNLPTPTQTVLKTKNCVCLELDNLEDDNFALACSTLSGVEDQLDAILLYDHGLKLRLKVTSEQTSAGNFSTDLMDAFKNIEQDQKILIKKKTEELNEKLEQKRQAKLNDAAAAERAKEIQRREDARKLQELQRERDDENMREQARKRKEQDRVDKEYNSTVENKFLSQIMNK